MNFTKIETDNINISEAELKVVIRPYVDNSVENMGLERYGLSVHDGVKHEEQLACLEFNGVIRYVTGLNEFAPDIKMIANPQEREAKVKQIRKIVSQLEKEMAANIIDEEDVNFWNNVKLLRPDNSDFWNSVILKLGNDPVTLYPNKNPEDMIKLIAIENGGFDMVAKSLEEARSRSVAPKFYLDKAEDTIILKNETKKLKNKALSLLEDMMDTNAKKLLYVTKVIDSGSARYRNSTSKEVMYSVLDDYIMGNSFDKASAAAKNFITVASLSMEDLKLRALVKDASFYKIIQPKADGYIYHAKMGSVLGRNPSDIVEFLKNPMNEDVFVDLMKTIEKEWNK